MSGRSRGVSGCDRTTRGGGGGEGDGITREKVEEKTKAKRSLRGLSKQDGETASEAGGLLKHIWGGDGASIDCQGNSKEVDKIRKTAIMCQSCKDRSGSDVIREEDPRDLRVPPG